ncbi:hypothetical protein BDN72DRAFT_769649 [Pluteus cervinus]|uniref:Uncharacterized protein n=1 Tax=Pluteus cervinus TaxID=181527 RepID=A0ACD3AR40_9AGAR|nr:hypothetical protein BDN72DRAFT_769649 [Pluteus cervinus]
MHFEDNSHYLSDSDQLIFGPIDMEDATYHPTEPVSVSSVSYPWDPFTEVEQESKPALYNFASSPTLLSPPYTYSLPHSSPSDNGFYDPSSLHEQEEPKDSHSYEHSAYLSSWVNDPEAAFIPSSPIPIPSNATQSSGFVPYNDHFSNGAFSPTGFAALHPLPRSMSPNSAYEEHSQISSISPQDMSLPTPAWATQLWDGPSSLRASSSVRPSVRHCPLSDNTVRPSRIPARRGSITSSQLFTSASAPSMSEPRSAAAMTRSYSRRSESVTNEDRDATIRKKKRTPEESSPPEKKDETPLKSVLRPPKLAPSAWQLYFTDWIQRQQATSTRKLNVAQAAKEAGQEYASLSTEEKEPYKRRSQAAKEDRERELAAYMKTLTPEDIKRENAFRAAQRKAGKSRRSNIKDPNAPKKPLSAYFMFLQRIRANPQLVLDIFGDETETTKQSVLAAAKWRSMTDAERQPFLAQAEQEKMEYESARRLYEEGHTGYGTSINFSILPGSPGFANIKVESESESDGFATDDGNEQHARS